MSFFATLDRENPMSAQLKVVGVGGGGCNAVESMINKGLSGVEYIVVNTDAQVLIKNSATHKIQVGTSVTRGLGAGADPNVGKKAVEEDREKLTKILEGSDMVFITAGMGGGTGTGGAPIVASIAKSLGALVVGIVTKPFRWEGKKRMMNAEQGIQELRQYVDSLIVIPNERLLNILDPSISANQAFDKPNEVLYEATRGIADIITIGGIINVDFADVRSVMSQSGEALMGCGIASGENRAIEAAQKAISSPLLEGVSIKGAKNILLNVTGSSSLTMHEIDEGNKVIYDAAGEEANVIFGWVNKEEMNEYVSYTVIATGFDSNKKQKETAPQVSKPQPTPSFSFGGYSRQESEQNEFRFSKTEDLDIPTIFRVKGAKSVALPEEEQIPQSGFTIDKIANYQPEDKKKQDDDIDDDESSSFLRMMMD
ncbi:MAG: cell division protein FtsZ [Ignavibacteria bacterium]|jgi:cell division protein FtsZ|nr:cell division protein FtsZ [Ignavibacteria bacterium]MCU7518026.1 cell division protein FtsZ [Ignavibacteria bacterium]